MVPEFGVLAGLYALADGVIIGGGWDKATHNVLEATAQGKIAACGPNWQKIAENHELVQQGYLQPIDAHGDWMKYLDQVGSEELAAKGEQARAWMLEQRGSAEKIVKVLEEAVQLWVDLLDNFTQVFWIFREIVLVYVDNQNLSFVIWVDPGFIALV